jgi:hypothetical protein
MDKTQKAKLVGNRSATTSAIRRRNDDGLLLEINIADMHTGKLAWGEETNNADYDTAIATKLCDEAFHNLTRKKIPSPIGYLETTYYGS